MLTLLAVVFVFGLLIVGHELGHYIVARLNGIKIMEFSFGMGPRILKFGKGETEYSLRAFPIGGFVKMLGEEEQVDDPRSFSTKPVPARMSVIAAGPVMNILISILIFAILAITVGYVKPYIRDFPKPSVESGLNSYPAKDAGLKVGDRIVGAGSTKILTYEDFRYFMYQNGNKPFAVKVNREGKILSFNITPAYDKQQGAYMIGISPEEGKAGIIEGIGYGAMSTWSFTRQIGMFLKQLVMGRASTEEVSGPVGIIKYTGEAARQGFGSLLMFTAFLSINLAIMNLIPFPALDGGWLLILLIEGIRRKKLDANKVGLMNFVGFAFLMILTVIITFRDFIRLKIF